MPFFRSAVVVSGPRVAVSVVRAGVPAVKLIPGDRDELCRFFSGLLWAWECRWLLFFGLGLGGFDSGPLEMREQMFCWWWDCGKAYKAGRSLGFFIL